MIVIVVEGGVVQMVYSDDRREDVKVLDMDNAQDPDSQVTPGQLRREIALAHSRMHLVF